MNVTDVKALQKQLDDVLAALKDPTKAPEVLVAEALAVAEQRTSAETIGKDDKCSSKLNRAFAISVLANLASNDKHERVLAEANFKNGSATLAALASFFDTYTQYLVDKGIRVATDAVHEAYYRRCLAGMSENEQNYYHLAMLTVAYIVAFKPSISPEGLAARFSSVLRELHAEDKFAVRGAIATMHRGWFSRIHKALWKFELPRVLLSGMLSSPAHHEELGAIRNQAIGSARKGGMLYVEAIEDLGRAECKLAVHPVVSEQYARFIESLKALKEACGELWEYAVVARLPEASLIKPTKLPDLVYAAGLYYKSTRWRMGNFKFPKTTSLLSKQEIGATISNKCLAPNEVDTIIQLRMSSDSMQLALNFLGYEVSESWRWEMLKKSEELSQLHQTAT